MANEPPAAPESDHEEYPSLEDAYGFVLPSIEWTFQRFAAIDMRIRHITGLMATVTAAVPIAAKALDDEVDLRSGWLIAAVVLGLLGIVTGAFAQTRGSLQLLMVEPMAKPGHLRRPSRAYRLDVLAKAGKIQKENQCRIRRRAWAATGLGLVLAAELLLFGVWLICG